MKFSSTSNTSMQRYLSSYLKINAPLFLLPPLIRRKYQPPGKNYQNGIEYQRGPFLFY